jgi:hypothetical protein
MTDLLNDPTRRNAAFSRLGEYQRLLIEGNQLAVNERINALDADDARALAMAALIMAHQIGEQALGTEDAGRLADLMNLDARMNLDASDEHEREDDD